MKIKILLFLVLFVARASQGMISAQTPDAAKARIREAQRELLLTRMLTEPRSMDTPLKVYELLTNRSVREELNFSYSNYLQYKQIMQRHDAETSDVLPKLKDIPSPKGALISLMRADIANQTIAAIEALLQPPDIDRLDQLVHYVEIAYRGLNVALADGKLGEKIGVTENQRTSIRTKGSKILADAAASESEIRRRTHETILQLLSPNQLADARQLLGEFFDGQDGSAQRQFDQNKDLRDEVQLRNAEGKSISEADLAKEKDTRLALSLNDTTIISLLSRESVRRDLGMDEQQRLAYAKMDAQLPTVQGNRLAIKLDMVLEILLPKQQLRLKQLAYFNEIFSRGYARAITQGQLGAALNVTDEQKPELFAAILELELAKGKEIHQVRRNAHDRILKELSSEQQQAASRELGEFFVFVDGLISSGKDVYLNHTNRKNAAP